MKVLLTGSTGFIGTHLISYLQSNHISITCLSREILSDNNLFNNFIK